MDNIEETAIRLYSEKNKRFDENILEVLMEDLYKTRRGYGEAERREIWNNVVKRLQQLYA